MKKRSKITKLIFIGLIPALIIMICLLVIKPVLASNSKQFVVSDIRITVEKDKAYLTWQTNYQASCLVNFDKDRVLRYALSIGTPPDSMHETVLTNLKPQTNYYFTVVCTNAEGEQASSYIQAFKTGKFVDYDNDFKITDRRILEIFPKHAVFYWTANRRGYPWVEYKVKDTTRVYTKHARRPGARGTHQVVVTGLIPSTEYYYRIVHKDEAGNTVSSGWFTFKTPPDTFSYKPFEIYDVKPVDREDINVFATEAVVTWQANRLTGGTVWYNEDGKTKRYKVAEYFPYSFNNHRLKLTDLKPDTRYKFQIESQDVFGNKFYSRVYEFRTKPSMVRASFYSIDVDQKPSYTRPMCLYKIKDANDIYAVFKQGIYKILSPQTLVLNNYLGLSTKVVSRQELEKQKKVQLLKVSESNTIYFLYTDRGIVKSINNPVVFESYPDNKWDDVVIISQADLENYKIAKLIKTQNSPSVYLIENNQKRPIVSEAVFKAHGFGWDDVVMVNKTDLDSYTMGESLK